MLEKAAPVRRDFDRMDQIPEMVFRILQMFNFLIILYITLLSCHALWGYVHEGTALDFLLLAGRVPPLNWVIPVSGLLFLGCLEILLSVECNNHPELIMRYTIDWQKRAMYILAVSVFSLMMNGNVLQRWMHVIPIDVVWSYYRADHVARLLGTLNIMNMINIYVFIFYMVILVLAQMSEKERILALNNELKRANTKLEEYASESARLAETRERNRLAREIHDTLGHSLTGILMDIAPEATKEQLRAIADVARTGINDVRHSVKALHADALESMELEDALQKLIDSTIRSTGVKISMRITTDLSHFNQDEDDVIYRVVQESITNAIRHGKASEIYITIDRRDGDLHIIISDNGVGCDSVTEGFGLHHMKERLEMLGGHMEYTGNAGFTIHALIPIRWGNEN